MSYQPKPDTGSLFKNDKRESDTHPNARGSALIDGVEYWIDSWTNVIQSGERSGEKYQSLRFKRKEAKQAQKPVKSNPKRLQDEDDDIPWN